MSCVIPSKTEFHFIAAALVVIAGLAAGRLAHGEEAAIPPGENLVVEGIPAIPASLAEQVRRYTEFRAARFSGWHPVRREMVVRTRFGDTDQVHRVVFPGGARTQLTFFPDRVSGASYPPAERESFIFQKDLGGNEFFQIYRYDESDGGNTLLTDGKSRNTSPVWSNAGDRIAYGSTRRNGRDVDLYVVNPSDPSSIRMLLQREGGGWSVSDWSPDDGRLLIEQYVSVNESHVWSIKVAAGQATLVTPPGGAEPVSYSGAKFSKDGGAVYVATDRDSEFHRLARIDLATGKHEYLTEHVRWDVEEFDLAPDGSTIAAVTNEDGMSRLRLFDANTGHEHPSPELPAGVIDGIEWHPRAQELGFTMSSANSPSDAYSLDVASGKVERWTTSETGGLDAANFAKPEFVRWMSFDGLEVSGMLYLPPARFTGPRPVLIDIHGGPEGQARPTFLGRANYLLEELGVALLRPNVRGSSGYGKTFLRLDNGMKREDSYRDIESLLDWIGTQPRLDAKRVAVTGVSYGGHMTFAVATRYGDRIAAALPVVGMSNLVTFLERTEAYRRDLRRAEYGDEQDPAMREFLLKSAPLTRADRIDKPLFVVQGGNDPRVPASEASQMVEAVRKGGAPVWYLVARDEGHGFAKKRNQDFQFYATVLFLREFLLSFEGT